MSFREKFIRGIQGEAEKKQDEEMKGVPEEMTYDSGEESDNLLLENDEKAKEASGEEDAITVATSAVD